MSNESIIKELSKYSKESIIKAFVKYSFFNRDALLNDIKHEEVTMLIEKQKEIHSKMRELKIPKEIKARIKYLEAYSKLSKQSDSYGKRIDKLLQL